MHLSSVKRDAEPAVVSQRVEKKEKERKIAKRANSISNLSKANSHWGLGSVKRKKSDNFSSTFQSCRRQFFFF